MFIRKLLRPVHLLSLFSILAFLPLLLLPGRSVHHPAVSGAWVYLSDLSWLRAHAGRAVLVSEGIPARDTSFTGSPLTLAGNTYERGIGTVVGSEIVFRLAGVYQRFAATVGLDDASAGLGGEVRFLVFLDEVQVFDSGLMVRGDTPQDVDLPVRGIQELRLVTLGTEGLADWADARLLLVDLPVEDELPSLLNIVSLEGQTRALARAQNWEALGELVAAEGERLSLLLGQQPTEGVLPPVMAVAEPERLTLTNAALSVTLGFGGAENGLLTVVDLAQQRVLFQNTTSTITLQSGGRYALSQDFAPDAPDSYLLQDVAEPGFGEGKQALARFRAHDDRFTVLVELSLFADRPVLLYRLTLDRLLDGERAAFSFLDAAGSRVTVGEDASYLTDYNRLRYSAIPDDGLIREERVGLGKPVFLWSRKDGRGLLLAAIDETPSTPYLTVQLPPGQVTAQVEFGSAGTTASDGLASPRLYVESTSTPHLQDAFANYRGVMGHLYPSLALPSWVRQQWLSWYVYYMDVNQYVLQEQIDTIAHRMRGLGPWHILVDAGWYVAEGRPEADWRTVDAAKFPDGLRALVDYAHARGVKVVLYFNTPYLNTREEAGNWMGLTGLIRAHPEWLIMTGQDELAEHYLFDYRQFPLRSYLTEVLRDFFWRYDVDGMKVDGLASSEGDLPGGPAGPNWAQFESLNQTMDIYRFTFEQAQALRPDLYIESGWSTPVFAHPYAHTFRFGDEFPNVGNPYPMGGLFEHINYAAYQLALGQPANMGALYGDPPDAKVLHWWLGAALAMGNQVSLSLPLAYMSDEALAGYRALLTHYRPFAGTTRTDGSVSPRWFATTNGPLTYVGFVNRSNDPQDIAVPLSALGLDAAVAYAAYDAEAAAFHTVQGVLPSQVPGQSFQLFVLRAEPGVVWTTAGYTESAGEGALELHLVDSTNIPGFVHVLVPSAQAVTWNGEALSPSGDPWPAPGSYTYAPDTRILTITYPPGDEHHIIVAY